MRPWDPSAGGLDLVHVVEEGREGGLKTESRRKGRVFRWQEGLERYREVRSMC